MKYQAAICGLGWEVLLLNRRRLTLQWGFQLGALALACCVFLASRSGAAEPVLVIVNGNNPVSNLSAPDVSRAFMKKLKRWPDGVDVVPVDLAEDSPLRESFSQEFHDKRSSAVKAYWQKMIFSGREGPPPEKSSSAEVVAFVRANRGAIGYVAAGTTLGSGVKVLYVDR
jgi:ABC-type phosphate transport system substrate-binding protein